MAEQVVGVAGLRHDVEAGVVEQAGHALAEEHGVVGEDDAHRRRPGARAQRGEVAAEPRLVELEDPLRLRQLRERPEAEVAELAGGGEHERRRLGGDDLAAVAGVRDPVRAVDLDADVAVLAERRGAGVEPDPDTHRRRPAVARDPPLRVDRGLSGGLGLCEDGEELVAARVDLVAVRRRYRFAEQAPEVGEDRLPALVRARGRAASSPRRRRRGR